MRGKIILGLFMILFLVQFVIATDTEIKIKTLPEHEVHLTILDPSVYSVLYTIEGWSDEYGNVSFTHSGEEEEFDLLVIVKDENDIEVAREKYTDPSFTAGEPVSLEVFPEDYEPESIDKENLTVNETESINETINEIDEGESKITGSAFFSEGGILSNKVFYYGIGLVAVIFVVLFSLFRKKGKTEQKSAQDSQDNSKKSEPISQDKKYSEKKEEKKEFPKDNQKLIEDAERKIREAQQEIKALKSEDRISEAKKKLIEDKKRLIEDQKELLRLRGGTSNNQNSDKNQNPNKNSGKNPNKNQDKKFSF